MLFHVTMEVAIPHDMASEKVAEVKLLERELSQRLQREGVWRHLWRVAGMYSNISIFDVPSTAELHDILTTLPLFPYMKIQVTALCRHPSSIHETDR